MYWSTGCEKPLKQLSPHDEAKQTIVTKEPAFILFMVDERQQE